jgi:hypothetical protein
MKSISNITSWLLMPILMPIYALVLVMFFPSEPINVFSNDSLFFIPLQNKIVLLLYYFMFSVFAPGMLYILLKKLKLITSLEMNDQNERKIPLVIMSLSCLFLFYLLTSNNFSLPKYIYGLCLSGAVIVCVFTFLNMYIKVSLHATGVGILSGFIIAYFAEQVYFEIWILAISFIISGLVLTSRLYLEKHTPKELIIGYSFSFVVTFLLNLFYPFA